MRDPRHDILFDSVSIGPLTAKNRFYQVPHCNGGGYRDPSAAAEMRATKAEGGWGVIFTEQTEMHHSSEITPFIELRLWEDQDIPSIARMAERMKTHGALAGIQLAYSGINGPNLYTKEVPLAPSALPIRTFTNDPVQARAMDREDIRNLRRWFVNAGKRCKAAGFDLICLYGAHGFGIFQHFLSRATNQRSDEYGGSLENRSRFVREVIADLRNAVGDTMGLTLRVSLDETIGDLGFSNAELRDFVAMNADLPDLWDLAHGTWEDCSGPSRFKEEAAQEALVKGIRDLTSRPVVGVGRHQPVGVQLGGRHVAQGVGVADLRRHHVLQAQPLGRPQAGGAVVVVVQVLQAEGHAAQPVRDDLPHALHARVRHMRREGLDDLVGRVRRLAHRQQHRVAHRRASPQRARLMNWPPPVFAITPLSTTSRPRDSTDSVKPFTWKPS